MINTPDKIYAYKYGGIYFNFSICELKTSKSKLYHNCELRVNKNPNGEYCIFDPFNIVGIYYIKDKNRSDFIRVNLEEINETKITEKAPKKEKRKIKLIKKRK